MNTRILITLPLAAVLAFPALAQTSSSDTPAASSAATTQSTDTATGKQPLQPPSREGFWGRVNPFARKNYVKRQTDPIRDQVAAISCGVFKDTPVLDLDYEEDSSAEADANFVLTGAGDIVEIQATGEKRGFTRAEFEALFDLARQGIGELQDLQRQAVA